MGKSGNSKNGSENGLPGQIFGHCLIFFFAQLTDFWAFNGAFFCVYLVQPSVAPSSSWGSATMEIPEQLLLPPSHRGNSFSLLPCQNRAKQGGRLLVCLWLGF